MSLRNRLNTKKPKSISEIRKHINNPVNNENDYYCSGESYACLKKFDQANHLETLAKFYNLSTDQGIWVCCEKNGPGFTMAL